MIGSTCKGGYTVPALKAGAQQRAKARDVFVVLNYTKVQDKFKVSVYTLDDILRPLFSQEFVSIRDARANFAHQLRRHFGQHLREINTDKLFGTCREMTASHDTWPHSNEVLWVCRYKGQEYGKGTTREEAQLRAWERENPAPRTEAQIKYEHYWSRPNAPKFLKYECPYCQRVLKTYKPEVNQTCDTMVSCPDCSGLFKIEVSHKRVTSRAIPAPKE